MDHVPAAQCRQSTASLAECLHAAVTLKDRQYNGDMRDSAGNRLRRLALILVIMTRSNLHAQMLPEGGALLEFIASEQQRFSVLTYAQSYLDDQHERVSYTGTLYEGIHSFKLSECEVVAQVAVQDRFSGAIEHRSGLGRVQYERTGELTDDTVYEYRFSLAKLDAGEITDPRARPVQFLSGTNFQCQEDRSSACRGCDLDRKTLISAKKEL